MNLAPNHLSCLESREAHVNLDDSLPNTQLFVVKMINDHYIYIVHILTTGYEPKGFNTTQKKQLIVKAADF